MRKTDEDIAINTTFTDVNNKYINLPITFLYQKPKLENYRFEKDTRFILPNYEIYPATIIEAELPIVSQHNPYEIKYNMEIIHINDVNLLLSLLNLKRTLSADLFEQFSDLEKLIRVDETGKLQKNIFKKNSLDIEPIDIKANDLGLIIKWCKENGYPFSLKPKISAFNIRYAKLERVDNKQYMHLFLKNRFVAPDTHINFWVWEFLRKLHILYSAFLMFYRINGKLFNTEEEIKNNIFSNYSIDYCKQILSRIYATVKLTGILDFKQYDQNRKSLLMGYRTADVFELAIYTLFIYMSLSGMSLSQCEICHKYYVPKNKKQKYCHTPLFDGDTKGTCYPQLKYKRGKTEKTIKE